MLRRTVKAPCACRSLMKKSSSIHSSCSGPTSRDAEALTSDAVISPHTSSTSREPPDGGWVRRELVVGLEEKADMSLMPRSRFKKKKKKKPCINGSSCTIHLLAFHALPAMNSPLGPSCPRCASLRAPTCVLVFLSPGLACQQHLGQTQQWGARAATY